MRFAADKVVEAGNPQVMLTERGVTFGYHDLIVDYRGIPEMQSFGHPVILDVTHSLQQPNQTSGVTGGMPQLIETIAKAGVAVGVDGLFMETHEDPSVAKSDGANMLKLDLLEGLLENWCVFVKVSCKIHCLCFNKRISLQHENLNFKEICLQLNKLQRIPTRLSVDWRRSILLMRKRLLRGYSN